MTDAEMQTLAAQAWADQMQAAFAEFVAVVQAMAQAVAAAFRAFVLQPLADAWSTICETAQRDQLYGDLLWLWVPAPLAGWLARRLPRRWLPALRV